MYGGEGKETDGDNRERARVIFEKENISCANERRLLKKIRELNADQTLCLEKYELVPAARRKPTAVVVIVNDLLRSKALRLYELTAEHRLLNAKESGGKAEIRTLVVNAARTLRQFSGKRTMTTGVRDERVVLSLDDTSGGPQIERTRGWCSVTMKRTARGARGSRTAQKRKS